MSKLKTLKGAALVIATSMLPLSQAAMAEITISGWVSEGMVAYDTGDSSDITQVTVGGNTLGTRITFAGEQEVSTGITAGFDVTIESRSGGLDWGTTGLEDQQNGHTLATLGSSVHVGGGWGKVTVGLQSMPTDNIAVLEDPSLTLWSGISPVFRGNGVGIRNGANASAGGSVWGNFLNCFTSPGLRGVVGIGLDCNGIYRNGIRYDLPAFGPVTIAVGYANDDIYDIAAKWKGDLGSMKGSIALGYAINQGPFDEVTGVSDFISPAFGGAKLYNEAENFQMQAGLMHPATGIFGSIAYQHEEADMNVLAKAAGMEDSTDAWWLKIGIKKQWFSMGDTSISFDYGQYEDQFGVGEVFLGVTGSEVERMGVALNQYFGSSLIIFGKWEQLDLDVDCSAATTGLGTCGVAYENADELDTFSLGAVYFF